MYFLFLGLDFQFDQFLFWILFLDFLGLWKFEKGEWEKHDLGGGQSVFFDFWFWISDSISFYFGFCGFFGTLEV